MASLPGIATSITLDTSNATASISRFDRDLRGLAANSDRHLRAAGSSFDGMSRTAQQSLRGISGAIAPISPGLASMAREASFAKTSMAALGVSGPPRPAPQSLAWPRLSVSKQRRRPRPLSVTALSSRQ